MPVKCNLWNFRKINGIEYDIQEERSFVLRVKGLSFLTEGNRTHAWKVRGMKIHKYLGVGGRSRDKEEVVFWTSSKVLFIIDRTQNYIPCSACVENARCEVSGKSFQWKMRYGRKRTFIITFILLSLLTARDQIDTVHSSCVESMMCDISGKSLT